jgi:carboxyl-terminal processing protease
MMLRFAIAALLLFAAVLPCAAEVEENVLERELRRFAGVYALVEDYAADPVSPGPAFYEGALPGMLRRLDPFSVFFSPDQFQQLRQLERSTTKGFGTVVSLIPGRVIVLQTLPGTPASRAGIQPGDEILAINGYRLDWLSLEQLMALLTEARRREAYLHVRRPGNARVLPVTMVPEEMASSSVDRAFLLEDGIGFVRITSFEGQTASLAKEAIDKLGGESLRGLVLDLRDNAGGLLPPALDIAAMFLGPGQKIMSVRGRAAAAEDTLVPNAARPYQFPIGVLINAKTASAAEIVAGALQDHRRGTILGERSFGKGLVQSIFPLSEGTALALTTAFYFTPNGRNLQKPLAGMDGIHLAGDTEEGGIVPDVTVGPEPTTRLRAVLEATGAFVAFATEAIPKLGTVDDSFQVSGALMDDLQFWLSQRNIRPSVSEMSVEREWIRGRLWQEILNQAVGVEKGDEVELRRDPQVRRAIDAIKGR